MEFDVLEVTLCHLENVVAVGQKNVAAFAVLGHELVLALFEGFQLCFVIAFYPARLVQADGFPTALGIVLVLQAVLYHFKLQLSYRTDDFPSVELVDEELCHALVHQLFDFEIKRRRFEI